MNAPMIDGWSFAPEDLMVSSEVARAFKVAPKTVCDWAEAGKLASLKTPGGQRRYSRKQVEHILAGGESS